jgi:hypothetical protein
MHAGIALMYVEGEIQGGCITGRTVLVIETTCELDPTSPNYSAAELQRIVSIGRNAWSKSFGPTDLVRLEMNKDALRETMGDRKSIA